MNAEFTIVKVENGYLLTREEVVSSEPFSDYKVTKFVFIDQDSLLAYLKDNV
jgi:hypothetical protein